MPLEEGLPLEREMGADADCDVDTIKKLKLGMRSTLWSRPSSTTSQIMQQQQQSMSVQQPQQQPHTPHRQQISPGPNAQKLRSEKSDYSISV